MRILIAEDNEADRYLIGKALEAAGVRFEAKIATNGEQAFAAIDGAGEPDQIDAAILDLNLTTHSGIEVLRQIRGTPAMAGMPVVVLTSSDSPQDRKQAEMLGTDAYISKPMDLDQFMEVGKRIASLLEERLQSVSQNAG